VVGLSPNPDRLSIIFYFTASMKAFLSAFTLIVISNESRLRTSRCAEISRLGLRALVSTFIGRFSSQAIVHALLCGGVEYYKHFLDCP